MDPFKPFTIREWGGLNEDENPSSLQPGELVEVLNASLLGKSLGTRPGLNREGVGAEYEDPITGGKWVAGLYHFSKNSDFKRDVLMAVSNKFVWVDDATSVPNDATADIATGLTPDSPMTFAQYRGHVYFTTFGQNLAQSCLHYWDGIPANSVFGLRIDNRSATPVVDMKYIIAKWGYLFAAGLDPPGPDSSSNKMVVRFNDIGADATLTASWPTANTIGTGDIVGSIGGLKEYGDEFITGLAEYQDNVGDWLLILTNRRIVSALRDSSTGAIVVDSAIANGCVHQNAYVNLGLDYGDAVYVSEHGIHSLRQSQEFGGREDSFLSWKIRRLFETLNVNRLQQICGGYDQAEGYVLLAVSTGSNTEHDTILCLDVRNKDALTADGARWYIWRLSGDEKVSCMTQARDPAGILRLYVGGTDGSVGYFSRKEYTDFGTGFSVSWMTKHDDFGSPTVEKEVGDIIVDVQPGGSYDPVMTTVFDFGSYQTPSHALQMPQVAARWEPSTQVSPSVWADGEPGEISTTGFLWASSAIITARNKLYGEGRGNTVATRYQHTGGNEPFWIAGQTLEIGGAGETLGAQGEGS